MYDLPALIPQEDSKEKVPSAAAPARCPGDVSASKGEPSDGAYMPLKDLHPKDIVPPTPYEGDSASWLDWSARFRRYAVSCSDRRLVQLLERIELLRGNPVTAADEANWEQELHLNIAEFKERLHTILEACTTGSAGLVVTQCGEDRVCDAWRQLADAGCSLREEKVSIFFQDHGPAVPRPTQGVAGVHDEVGA